MLKNISLILLTIILFFLNINLGFANIKYNSDGTYYCDYGWCSDSDKEKIKEIERKAAADKAAADKAAAEEKQAKIDKQIEEIKKKSQIKNDKNLSPEEQANKIAEIDLKNLKNDKDYIAGKEKIAEAEAEIKKAEETKKAKEKEIDEQKNLLDNDDIQKDPNLKKLVEEKINKAKAEIKKADENIKVKQEKIDKKQTEIKVNNKKINEDIIKEADKILESSTSLKEKAQAAEDKAKATQALLYNNPNDTELIADAKKAEEDAKELKEAYDNSKESENDIRSRGFTISVNDISPGMKVGYDTTEENINFALGTIIQKLMIGLGSFAMIIMTIGAGYIILHSGQDEILSKGKSIFMSGVYALFAALGSYYLVSIFRYILFN